MAITGINRLDFFFEVNKYVNGGEPADIIYLAFQKPLTNYV